MKNIIAVIVALLLRFWNILKTIFVSVFGVMKWDQPNWWKYSTAKVHIILLSINRFRKEQPRYFYGRFLASAAILAMSWLAYDYYQNLPTPDLVEVTGSTPTPMGFQPDAKPDVLHIQFSKSVAAIDKISKDVSDIMVMKPKLKGKWHWFSENELQFTPDADWPVDERFVVDLPKALFQPGIKLSSNVYEFSSPKYQITSVDSEFYQDPSDPKTKRVVVSVNFSHPPDLKSLEDQISFQLGDERKSVLSTLTSKSYGFKISYDAQNGRAFIQTDSIPIPSQDSRMHFVIKAGVKSTRGGETDKEHTGDVTVPGMYSYFRVNSAQVDYIENEKFETEQALNIDVSAEVAISEVAKNLTAFLLPTDRPKVGIFDESKNHSWSPSEVTPEILKLSQKIPIEPLPTATEAGRILSFKVGVEPERQIFVRLSKGVKSFAGYELAEDYTGVIRVENYPQRVSIMAHGSLLSMSGEKKVSVAARDVQGLKFKLERLLPGQLQHFVSQTSKAFERPNFTNYQFGSENITEVFSEIKALEVQKKGITQYSSIDFAPYIKGGRGLFIFTAQGWNIKKKRQEGPSDQRVILVTDMGILAKANHDQSLTVFIQSIRSGSPLTGVKVDAIGKNGLPVFSSVTGEQGAVTLPKLTAFNREKEVVAFVATRGEDLSFLPFNRSGRQLNVSRFDIGGAHISEETKRIEAFLFSERGIYRPGEAINIGVILKSPSWLTSEILGAPLEFGLRDPRGLEIFKRKFQVNQDGFHEFQYQTSETSPTGPYEVSVYLTKNDRRGPVIGSATIKVNEFLPDRLRINTTLSKESSQGWVKLEDLTGQVLLHNLFGTPAEDRNVQASFSVNPIAPSFKGLKDYQFANPNKNEKFLNESLGKQQTNKDGVAEFKIPLSKFSSGLYRVAFSAEGFEASGGRGVFSQSSTVISNLDAMVGMKSDGPLNYIRKDSERAINLIAIDSTLKKIAIPALKASIVEFKYVSVLMRQSSGLYKYESVKKEIPGDAKPLSIPTDGLNYKLPTTVVGQFALVIKDEKDNELNRMPFSIVGDGNVSRSLDKNSELQLVLSKQDYEPGETIELEITAPYVGAGLITIEREKVFATKWFKTTTTSTVQQIRLPSGIEGNAYISVSFIRAPESKDVFMSPLSYGVIPFTVNRESRSTKIDLKAPERAEPGKELRIGYSTNRPAKIVLFGVDEGILQVANYQTPKPLDFFLRKRALQVDTFQILDLIMPEFSVLKSASAPGGGEGGLLGANLNPFKRKTQNPVVFWSGIIDSDTKNKEFRYQVPDYFNGSLKVMAIAVSQSTIGSAEVRTLVRGPFIISANAPTFVAPGDQFTVSAGVSNNLDIQGEQEIEVTLSLPSNLQGVDVTPKKLKLSKGREGTASFTVKAADLLGDANITFKASGGGKTTTLSSSLSIRPPVVHQTISASGIKDGGDFSVAAVGSMYKQFSRQVATISPFPIVMAKGLGEYLTNFAHSCTEQLVGKVLPFTILAKYKDLDLTGEKSKDAVEKLVRILRSRQNSDGTYGTWGVNEGRNAYLTIYVTHVLTDLAEEGFAIPQDMVKQSIRYLQSFVQMPDNSIADARDKAYAVYVLHRNGISMATAVAELATVLDKKYPKPSWRSELTGAFMASIYQMMRATSEADSLIAKVNFGEKATLESDRYFDSLRNDGQLLYLISKHFPQRAKAISNLTLLEMSNNINLGAFSTQSAAQAIMGLNAFAKVQGDVASMKIEVSEVDKSGKKTPLTLKGERILSSPFSLETKQIEFTTPPGVSLFYQVVQSGFPNERPKDQMAKHLEVFREFTNDKGQPVTEAKVGDVLNATVRVRATDRKFVPNIALVDLLPGGFEVELSSKAPTPENMTDSSNSTMGDIEGEGNYTDDVTPPTEAPTNDTTSSSSVMRLGTGSWQAEYADIREDRVIIYGAVTDQVSTFSYRVRATTKGEFFMPPVFAEALYDREVQATSKSGSFKVTD